MIFTDALMLWGTLVAGIGSFFELIEKSANDKVRKAASSWITRSICGDNESRWQQQVVYVFDSIYGQKICSKKFIFRSIASSAFGILFSILVIVLLSQPDTSGNHLISENNQVSSFDLNEYILLLLAMFPIILLFNLIPDFFSLIETRLILGQMEKEKDFIATIFFLAYDFSITLLIYFVYVLAVIMLGLDLFTTSPLAGNNEIDYKDHVTILWGGASIGFIISVVAGFFSTFFTSIWVWSYILVGYTYRLAIIISRPFKFVSNRLLNASNHPFRAMGVMLALVITFFINCGLLGIYIAK